MTLLTFTIQRSSQSDELYQQKWFLTTVSTQSIMNRSQDTQATRSGDQNETGTADEYHSLGGPSYETTETTQARRQQPVAGRKQVSESVTETCLKFCGALGCGTAIRYASKHILIAVPQNLR